LGDAACLRSDRGSVLWGIHDYKLRGDACTATSREESINS